MPLPATLSAGGLLWTRIDTAFGHAQPGPVTALRDGLFMASLPFGSMSPGTAQPHSTLWRSADAEHWQRLSNSRAFSGRPSWIDWILGLAARGRGLIAVGMEQYADGSNANAEAWVSPDGVSWRRATVGDGIGETMDFAYPVARGFAAIGTDGYSFHAGMERGTAIWTSTDGTRWLRLPQSEVPAHVSIRSVAHGNGRYVAVGEPLPFGAPPTGSVPIWTSVDGVRYRMLSRSFGDPPADAVIAAVIWTGSAFVAVGTEEGVGAFAWRSADGLSWRQVELGAARPGSVDVRAGGIAPTSRGLLAIGMVDPGVGLPEPAAWLSTSDGRDWQPLSFPPALAGVSFGPAYSLGGHPFVSGSDQSTGTTALWALTDAPPAP